MIRALAASVLLVACQPQRAESPIPDRSGVVGGEGEGEAPLEFDAEDRLTNPTGQWALFTEAHHCLTALGATIENVVWAWYRTDLSVVEDAGDGERALSEVHRLCDQEVSPVHLGLETEIPPAIPASLDPVVSESFVFGEDRGDRYVSGLHLDLWGAGGVGEADELPLDPEDGRVVDTDGDGNPGATIVLGGTCDVYIVQRTTARRRGEIIDAAHIEGTFQGRLGQRVLDASTSFCKSENELTPGGSPSRFVLVRVDGRAGSPDLDVDGDGDVSCAELLDASGPLLAGVGFTRLLRDDEVCATQ